MKAAIFEWLVSLSLFGLLARLAAIQLIDYDYYQTLARENRVRVISLPASRGGIFDRFGQPLAADGAHGREYYLGAAGAHVLGYVAEGDNQLVGREGLEFSYDELLRGRPGSLLVETLADGSVVREIGRQEPVGGQDLITTLDKGLQQMGAKVLAGSKGAVVVSQPQTGEILALVSAPAFDPVLVTKFLNDENQPLFNRAISGTYPPGSIFKIITAAAGLEDKKITGQTVIEDTGTVRIGDYTYANWYFTQYGRTEGKLDLVGAIKRSNDIFFYKVGEKLGIKALSEWAKFFGVGRLTGIDLPGEAKGLMPDSEWKQTNRHEPWYLGDTLISAIGQGNILMTPLQVNVITGIIANRGSWCRPHLAGKSECRHLDINPDTLDLIIEGMVAVNQPGGTAYPFFNYPVDVAGKTGTAEFGPTVKGQTQTHAWYTAFAPVQDPAIAVTVLLEGGGEGSAKAAPIAKELLTYWFARQ
jgi:penicillin-binding protein 2